MLRRKGLETSDPETFLFLFARYSIMALEEGRKFDVSVEHESEMGDGLVKVEDSIVFLPAVGQGSEFKIQITKSFEKVAFAKIVKE